jgi:hypothetical protein
VGLCNPRWPFCTQSVFEFIILKTYFLSTQSHCVLFLYDFEKRAVIVLEIKNDLARLFVGLAEMDKMSYFAEHSHFGATGNVAVRITFSRWRNICKNI